MRKLTPYESFATECLEPMTMSISSSNGVNRTHLHRSPDFGVSEESHHLHGDALPSDRPFPDVTECPSCHLRPHNLQVGEREACRMES
jgi:hypothetical protein